MSVVYKQKEVESAEDAKGAVKQCLLRKREIL